MVPAGFNCYINFKKINVNNQVINKDYKPDPGMKI